MKGMGMGIGRITSTRNGDEHKSVTFSMLLLGWNAIISHNSGRGEHWDLLGDRIASSLAEVCDRLNYHKIPVYVCTQSKFYISKFLKNNNKIDLREINGKQRSTYEYVLKEEVGREVKKKLWIDRDEETVRRLINEETIRRIVVDKKIYNIKERRFPEDELS
jgi:hypothetical protein